MNYLKPVSTLAVGIAIGYLVIPRLLKQLGK